MDQDVTWYEDSYCYYFWKPHNIASSFGQGPCFLDIITKNLDSSDEKLRHISEHLSKEFGIEGEYGLLNRLDNDTAGLLYFAKNLSIKNDRKHLQKNNKITKYYIADVQGEVSRDTKIIAYPIAHHPQASDRMICIKNSSTTPYSSFKKVQYCETFVEKMYYDKDKNYSCILVRIHTGVRHQIRCHLASIGCPIIGEKIYKKRKDSGILHLWSIGVEV